MHKHLLLLIGLSFITIDAQQSERNSMQPHLLLKIFEKIVNNAITNSTITVAHKQPSLLMITRTNPRQKLQQKADQEQMRKIFASFANIMQCFFRIVQNPENKENVTLGIAGMLANVLQAGHVIMEKTDIFLDSDKQTVEKWLTTIDTSSKRTMCMIVAQNKHHVTSKE